MNRGRRVALAETLDVEAAMREIPSLEGHCEFFVLMVLHKARYHLTEEYDAKQETVHWLRKHGFSPSLGPSLGCPNRLRSAWLYRLKECLGLKG